MLRAPFMSLRLEEAEKTSSRGADKLFGLFCTALQAKNGFIFLKSCLKNPKYAKVYI